MDWVKLNTRGILRGSLCMSTDIVQLVWIKLICLMQETKNRNGRFEYAHGKPYSLDYIATNCAVSSIILEGCICEYEEDISPDDGLPRTQWDNTTTPPTLILTNWYKYQAKPDKVIAKEISIAKARETKSRQEAVVTANTRLTNELQAVIKQLEGAGVQLPIKCPYCSKKGIKDKVTLARHIYQSSDNGHIPALGWAKEILGIKEGGE